MKPDSNKGNQKNQHIQVFVRCRPLNVIEKKQFSPSVVNVDPAKKEVTVKERISDKICHKTFSFDKVFGPETKQVDVYRAVVQPLIEEVLMGYNCTVFAYGQTGTGKTYTMEGERSASICSWEADPAAGVIPRSLHQLFEELTKGENVEFSIRVSFLELYNEEVFDLLSPTEDLPKLRLFEDPARKGSVVIQGLEEIAVHSKDEVYAILEKGTARRQTAATMMNASSSRSHSIFSVTVHIKENTLDGEELLKTGKLNLVDLAGSENIGRSGAVDKRAREAGNINQSLLTLGRVITSLVEKAPHIPYRESKLTRLLQDSLGGHTKTSIIATISPALCNIEETSSTLDYAHRAKNITNRPEVNMKTTKRALIKEYTEEIERLRRNLTATRDKRGIQMDMEQFKAMERRMASQTDEIKELQNEIDALTEQIAKVEELFSTTKEELDLKETLLSEELKKSEYTSNVLQTKSEVLNYTQKAFSKDVLENTEKQQLIKNQMRTEQKLSQQTKMLLEVAEQTTTDVSALHAKIDRNHYVEHTNEVRKQQFKDALSQNLQSFDDNISRMIQQHIEYMQSLRNCFDASLKKWTEQHLIICSIINNWSVYQLKGLDCLNESLNSDDDEYKCWASNTLQNFDFSLKNLSTEFDAFVLGDFNMLFKQVQCIIEMQEANLQMLKQDIFQKIEQSEKAVLKLLTKCKQMLADLSECFMTEVEHQCETLKKCSQISAFILSIRAMYREDFESKMQSCNLLIDSLRLGLENQQEKMGTALPELQENVNHAFSNNSGICKKMESHICGVTSYCEKFADDCTSSLHDSKAFHTEKNAAFHGHITDLGESLSHAHTEVSSFFLKNIQEGEQTSEILENEIEKQAVNSTSKLQNKSACVMKMKSALGQSRSDQESQIKISQKQHEEYCKEQLELCSDMPSAMNQWDKSLKNEILKADEDFTRFLSDDFEKNRPTDTKLVRLEDGSKELKQKRLCLCNLEELYQKFKEHPSGETPERKNYIYPETFASTSPHERILQRFRLQQSVKKPHAIVLPLNESIDESEEYCNENMPFKECKNTINESVEEKDHISFACDDSSCETADSSLCSLSDRSYDCKENQNSRSRSGLPRKVPVKKVFRKSAPAQHKSTVQ